MNYIVDHIPKSTPYNRRQGLVMKPEYITIHNTGNEKSTAQNERNWLTNPTNDRQASFHIVVDENNAIECIPLNENAWACGDGFNGTGNRKSINIEICESGNYQKAVENAIKLTVELMNKYNIPIENVKRHFDWSGKICPRLMYDKGTWNTWKQFKQDLQKEVTKEKVVIAMSKYFKDVPQSHWALNDIDALKEKGVLAGKTDGTFGIGETIKREEVAVLINRAIDYIIKNKV
ncbi:N-acetylmuramoyl-L-alanine amidase [Schinkia azotoformans]|uniref:N-acetylmuramoyl-L-alanine amidase n=1 Tax=Schinkia azotoformans TaxID=1454 RepID=UPI002E1A8529|nr:N-acetylmuramoyl-L-alanine amidase [Schinkia azotoformans]MED4354796.1 N-acetylmuramoyl-L-alanine amidase [Schinkia azotoformans]